MRQKPQPSAFTVSRLGVIRIRAVRRFPGGIKVAPMNRNHLGEQLKRRGSLARYTERMTDDGLGLLPKYAKIIRALPADGLSAADYRRLLVVDEPPIQIVYAPFDWINESARVVVCGITPGKDSMTNALMAARDALRAGKSLQVASMRAKRTGMFSNMRGTLGSMLDELGLNRILGIETTRELFGDDGEHRDMVQLTSCVRYPVFVNGKNYSGHTPKLMKSPILVRFIDDVLGAELQRLKDALIVPCGDAVDGALRHLAARGIISEDHCLFGFPHASGSNGHRLKFFEKRKADLTAKVAAWGEQAPSPTVQAGKKTRTQTAVLSPTTRDSTGALRTQTITATDLAHGRVRLPRGSKSVFPNERSTVQVRLCGRVVDARYDPRTGPDKERSAVLSVGKSALGSVAEGTMLSISRDISGLISLD